MPRGAGTKREREYTELKEEFKEEGRYKGREEEVAARIVNKQRAQQGETNEAKARDKAGTSPDQKLPIPDYDQLTVDQVMAKLDGLSRDQLRAIKSYEEGHKRRKTLLEQLDRRL